MTTIGNSGIHQMLAAIAGHIGARMAIGAVHAAFLLSTGIGLETIANLQIIFSATFLLFNMPLGVMADKYGSKICVVSSIILLICYFLLCLLSPNLIALYMASIIYALSLSLIAGADTSLLKRLIEKHRPDDKNFFRDTFYLLEQRISIVNFACGFGGAILVYLTSNYGIAYILGVIFAIYSLWQILQTPPEASTPRTKYKEQQPGEKFTWVLHNRDDLIYGLLILILTAMMQPIYYFWQPLVIEAFKLNAQFNKEDIALLLGICFGSYTLLKYFFTKNIRKKIDSDASAISITSICLVLSGVCAIGILLAAIKSEGWLVILFISLFHSFSSIPFSTFYAEYTARIPQQQTATKSSAISVLGRISSIVTLGVISWMGSNDGVIWYFLITIACAFLALLPYMIWVSKKGEAYIEN